ncbi:hypothetical protein [Campylobacter cuniculorum]|uniref:hypothetical protein n=1 Tax=Campylobacter cuniculorum TaxID=374106 RepID=UPI0023F21BD7|nr:hypothetical protein [Campylobacter cuniculorum]
MKKILATLLIALVSTAYADGIYGTIVDVNDAAKTILVETTYGERLNMKILPNTEIDMDDCGLFGMDKYGTFRDLKVGTFLEAEIFYGYQNPNTQPNQPAQIKDVSVRKIDIECRRRAY